MNKIQIPVGKIVDSTKENDVLKATLYKPLPLLKARAVWLNLHDMAEQLETGKIESGVEYLSRYLAIPVTEQDFLPVEI